MVAKKNNADRKTAIANADDDYNASSILVLDDHQKLIQNMSLTFGDMENDDYPYSQQKDVAVREILDNGLDEIRSGHGTKLRLSFYKDGSFEVQDSGRGIPVDNGKDVNGNPMSGIYLAMGVMGAGRNYTNDAKRFSSGRHGLGGASTVHASYRADVIVYRPDANGKPMKYSLSFKDGTPGFFDDSKGISKEYLDSKGHVDKDHADIPERALHPFTPIKDYTTLKVEPDKRTKKERDGYETGTDIRIWLSDRAFRSYKMYNDQDLIDRLRDTAFLVPQLNAEVYDELNMIEDPSTGKKEPQREFFHFQDGMDEFINIVQMDEPICDSIRIKTVGKYIEKNAMDRKSNSEMTLHDQERELPIDIILRYGNKYDTNVRTYVNTIRTKDNGQHYDGFVRGLVSAFNTKFRSMRGILKKDDPDFIDKDYLEGLTAIVSVLVSSPNFSNQTKARLDVKEVTKAMKQSVENAITEWCDASKNRKTLNIIAQKVSSAAKNRMDLDKEKAKARQAKSISVASMPEKLSECEFVGEPGSELFICEGDSAKSGLMKARDPRFQAILPVRGKSLNFLKASDKQKSENAEAQGIIKALGCGTESMRNFDIENMRYSRVILATDADVDGWAIQDLLLTLFWEEFPEIIKNGRLFVSLPPLFEISFKGKAKGRETDYAVDDNELQIVLAKLKKEKLSISKDFEIHRNKGLGENDFDVTWNTMMNPDKRTLMCISIEDAGKAATMLHLAMGKESNQRTQWIEENYDKFNPDLMND